MGDDRSSNDASVLPSSGLQGASDDLTYPALVGLGIITAAAFIRWAINRYFGDDQYLAFQRQVALDALPGAPALLWSEHF